MFLNVRPRLIRRIPWGWVNKNTVHGLVVVKSPGEIKVPNIMSHFDWRSFELQLPPPSWYKDGLIRELGTMDMKSILTTAIRFLGWELTWINLEYEKLDLTLITDAFVEWNERLLNAMRGSIRYFMIGDEYAYNEGLFMSPDSWREVIKPHLKRLINVGISFNCKIIFHADGDVFKLLDDFVSLGVEIFNFEPVGKMKIFVKKRLYKGMQMWMNTPYLESWTYDVNSINMEEM